MLDILHPLTAINWQSYGQWSEGRKLVHVNSQCVLLNDKIYIVVQTESNNETKGRHYSSFIYAITTDLSMVTSFTLPDVSYFTLTTYHSQLVLVGGITLRLGDPANNTLRNELWVSDDGTNWNQSLPPMPTRRYGAAVANTKSPEYLIVAGGAKENYKLVDTVEVLIEAQWFTLQPLPRPTNSSLLLHNGNLYFVNHSDKDTFYCRLESLLESCSQVRADKLDTKELWKIMRNRFGYNPVSFGGRLMAMELNFELYAYSPLTQSWALVGTVPSGGRPQTAIVIPTGELVLIGYERILKGTLKESPYDPDSWYSKSALSRLEAAGIPVLTSLSKKPLLGVLNNPINLWISRESSGPAAWQSLYDVLKELDLEKLGQQIEEYLTCPKTLKEQSTAVIMSALLQHRLLNPDQLYTILPDYVPPSFKHFITITHTFKAHKTIICHSNF